MLFDLEPYLPFNVFVILYTIAFVALFNAASNRSK